MRRVLFLCLLAVPLLLGFKAGDKVIKVGVGVPLSAGAEQIGTDVKNGVALAAAEWNAKGGVLGKKIELVVGDDRGDAAMAATVANKLIESGVVGVIGHVNSDVSLAALKYYNRAGIPMITPASTNPGLTTKGYTGVFRTCGKDDLQTKIAADFIAKFKFKKIAFIHDKTIYGQWLVDEFMKHVRGKVDEVHYAGFAQEDKDFQPILKALLTKQPSLIYFGGIYSDAAFLLKQSRESGIDAVFMSADAAADQKFIELAGAANTIDVYFTAAPDIKKQPSAKNFVAAYEQKFGAIGEYSAYAYDAANALFKALEQAGTTSGKQVVQELHDLSFDGVTGKIKFDAKGDGKEISYSVWTIKDGKLVEYK